MMMVRNEVKPHGVLALHSQHHAQMTMVLAGACDVTMEGETFHLTTDGVVYFPPDVPHEVVNTGETTLILLDVFTPIREDFCHNRKSRRIPFENLSAFCVIRFGQRGCSWLFPAGLVVPASRSGYTPDDCLSVPDNRGGRHRRRGTAMLCRYRKWK